MIWWRFPKISKADISESLEYKRSAEVSNLARIFFFETFSVEVQFRDLLKGDVVAVY